MQMSRDFVRKLNQNGIRAYVKEGAWKEQVKIDNMTILLKQSIEKLTDYQKLMEETEGEIAAINMLETRYLIKR